MSSKELYDVIKSTNTNYKIYHLFNAKTLENTLHNTFYYIISDVYSGFFEIYRLPFDTVCKLSIHDNSHVVLDDMSYFNNVVIIDDKIYQYSLYKTNICNNILERKIDELIFTLI